MHVAPRFDRPNFTVDGSIVFANSGTGLDEPAALPALREPDDQRAVIEPVDEPLVEVAHRRIRTLENYWHGGWKHAVPRTRVRAGVAERLYVVADALPPRWGLAVFDGWRPLDLQIELYETALADPNIVDGFMAPPSTNPMTPPPHLSGGAVDLTLTYDDAPLALGTGFDDTTPAAYVDALEHTSSVDRQLRRYLCHAMFDEGFVVYAGEWWHFEYGTRRWSGITNERARYAATE